MKTTETLFPDKDLDPGLTETQVDVIYHAVAHLLRTVTRGDTRPYHFALLVMQLEPESTDEQDVVVTTNMISSMTSKEDVHEFLRGWMHRETQ